MQLVGTTALVTGAGQGIGYAIASRLMLDGANVAALELDAALAEPLAAALEEQAGNGTRALAVTGDVTSAADVERAFTEAEAAFGPVTMLVNNAGVAKLVLLADMSEEDWDRTIAVCLKGTFLCLRRFARRAIDGATGGAVVNIGSLNGMRGSDGLSHYSAAKAGIQQLTEVAASELGRHGIRVNAIAPGVIETPLTKTAFLGPRMREEYLAHTPLGRIGEVGDIASVAAFLLSEEARWITGATIPVDGGNHVRGLHSFWDTMHPA